MWLETNDEQVHVVLMQIVYGSDCIFLLQSHSSSKHSMERQIRDSIGRYIELEHP